jgi:hypothetical protein
LSPVQSIDAVVPSGHVLVQELAEAMRGMADHNATAASDLAKAGNTSRRDNVLAGAWVDRASDGSLPTDLVADAIKCATQRRVRLAVTAKTKTRRLWDNAQFGGVYPNVPKVAVSCG